MKRKEKERKLTYHHTIETFKSFIKEWEYEPIRDWMVEEFILKLNKHLNADNIKDK